jgi:predicted transcriptional regulator
MSGSPSSYRDRIYIVKDVILKLVEYGELNQTALVSFCGLNLKKHKSILEDIEDNDLIERREVTLGKRIITMYRPTQKVWHFASPYLTQTAMRSFYLLLPFLLDIPRISFSIDSSSNIALYLLQAILLR